MKKVLVITGSRGEYGYIRPLLIKCKDKNKNGIECQVLATNMHLLESHGYSLDEFKKDDIEVKYKSWNTLDGNNNLTMVKSLFIFGLSLVDICASENFDAILLAGDRGEQLIGSILGFHINIPVIHIQAGERSGHIDGMSRHAIARFAHIHLAANKDAVDRLEKFGEQKERIKLVGAPQMDEIYQFRYDIKDTLKGLSIDLDGEFALLVFHPVAEELKINFEQFKQCLDYLNKLETLNIIAIFPNSDSGSELISNYLSNFLSDKLFKFRNVSREHYLNLLNSCKFIIGNSSSGIIEAPALKTPAINIGRRQEGRLRGLNVIDCPNGNLPELEKAIKKISSKDFIKHLEKDNSPYGEGDSTDKIIDIIQKLKPNSELLTKQVTC